VVRWRTWFRAYANDGGDHDEWWEGTSVSMMDIYMLCVNGGYLYGNNIMNKEFASDGGDGRQR
jgi:hypothetical protein